MQAFKVVSKILKVNDTIGYSQDRLEQIVQITAGMKQKNEDIHEEIITSQNLFQKDTIPKTTQYILD